MEKEVEKQLLEMLNDKRTGLRDSSNTNKTRYGILGLLDKALLKKEKDTLKELIKEYHNAELEGKGGGYDFYFSIRTKIDNLNKHK